MRDRDAAHGVHQLVLVHGHERAREMVPVHQRSLVDIAAEVLADERQNIGISYTGFCLTSLPHKRLPENQAWQKQGHRVTLLVEPGRLKTAKGEMRLYGVPYGARARMILLYLQTQAVRTGSPQVALGRSMRNWMERMGLAVGGETARSLREQSARISACTLKFFWEGEAEVRAQFGGASGLLLDRPTMANQNLRRSPWFSGGILSHGFSCNRDPDQRRPELRIRLGVSLLAASWRRPL
jgi:hypothetical protein